MANRRHFLTVLTGASWAAMGCGAGSAPGPDNAPQAAQDDLERALSELNRSAEIGIADDDFERARSYAAGAYREAAKSLRPIELDPSLDLPVAFSARRTGR
jgi:hypothetical protein